MPQQAYTGWMLEHWIYTEHPKDWSMRKVVHPNSLPSHRKLTGLNLKALNCSWNSMPVAQLGRLEEKRENVPDASTSLLFVSVSRKLAGLRFQHHKTSGKLLKSMTNCVLSSCDVCAYCGLNVVHTRQKPTCGWVGFPRHGPGDPWHHHRQRASPINFILWLDENIQNQQV